MSTSHHEFGNRILPDASKIMLLGGMALTFPACSGTNLGIALAPQKSGGLPWQQEDGVTIFDPFEFQNEMILTNPEWNGIQLWHPAG